MGTSKTAPSSATVANQTPALIRGRSLVALFFALIAILTVLAPSVPAHADASDDVVRKVDVNVELDKEGIAHITETYTWDFGDRNGLGFYRTLTQYMGWPQDPTFMRKYEYSNFAVSSPSGAPAEVWVEGEDGDELRVSVGAPDGSDDTRSGVQTYVLSYDMAGALNQIRGQESTGNQDEFYWNAFNDWDVLMEDITVNVHGPSSVVDVSCYAGPNGSSEPCDDYASSESTATFHADALPAGDVLSIMAAYEADSFTNASPILIEVPEYDYDEYQEESSQNIWPWVLGIAVAIIAGIAGLVAFINRKSRDYHYVGLGPTELPRPGNESYYAVEILKSEPPVTVQQSPPVGLRPAEAALLLDKNAKSTTVSATILDLAVRGYLIIAEVDSKGRKKPNDWLIMRAPNPPGIDGLKPFEAKLLSELLGARESVLVSDLKGSFYDQIDSYRKDLLEAAYSNEWLLKKLGRPRLPKGRALYEQSRGFREYLRTVDASGLRWDRDHDVFSAYLPWAVAFGLTNRWNEMFEQRAAQITSEEVIPIWYLTSNRSSPTSFKDVSYAMHRFSSTAATSLATTPASSGGSGSFSSGGGFAGGGGGGGGGGGR